MVENIDDNTSEVSKIPESEPLPEELLPAIRPDATTPNQKAENMDVYGHHLHHAPDKKIWHYFYEYLMLFLAMFCGFLA